MKYNHGKFRAAAKAAIQEAPIYIDILRDVRKSDGFNGFVVEHGCLIHEQVEVLFDNASNMRAANAVVKIGDAGRAFAEEARMFVLWEEYLDFRKGDYFFADHRQWKITNVVNILNRNYLYEIVIELVEDSDEDRY